jgi:tRNA threonylcarbamoyladenosine biosynthesis protein TsaB
MRILAFDCAGAQCAGAIVVAGRTVAVRRIAAERGHAQLLVPMLRALLAEAALSFGDIDRFVVTTGPGSFTGIRVALATAHGLALATGAPVVGVTVFEILAAAAIESGVSTPRLLVAVESKRSELYVQLFAADGDPIGAPSMAEADRLAAWAGPGALTLTGDAAARAAPYLDGAEVLDNAQTSLYVDPAMLARIGALRETGAAPVPFYLRPPDAIPSAAR